MNSFSLPAFLGRFPNALLGALLGPACAHSSAPSPAMASLSSSSPTGTTICCLLCTKPSLVQVFLLDYSLYMQFTFSLLVPPAEFPSSHLPVTAASVFSGLSCTLPNQSAKTNVMLAFLIHPLTVTFFPSSLGKKKKGCSTSLFGFQWQLLLHMHLMIQREGLAFTLCCLCFSERVLCTPAARLTFPS